MKPYKERKTIVIWSLCHALLQVQNGFPQQQKVSNPHCSATVLGGKKEKKKKKHRAKTTGHCKCVQRKKKIKICKNFQCFLTYHKETKVGKVNFFPSLLLSLNINRRSIPNQQESLLSLTTPTTCLLQLLFSRKDSINQHLHGLVTCNECKQRQKSTGLEYSMNQW